MENTVGYKVTGDPSSGVLIGGTTDPIVIYGVFTAGADGTVTLQNESSGGSQVWAHNAALTNGEEDVIMFGFGITFPNGCWYTNPGGTGADAVYYKNVV